MSWRRVEQHHFDDLEHHDFDDTDRYSDEDDIELLSEPQELTTPQVASVSTQTERRRESRNTVSASASSQQDWRGRPETRERSSQPSSREIKWARLLKRYLAVRKLQLLFSNIGNLLRDEIAQTVRDRVARTYPVIKDKRR